MNVNLYVIEDYENETAHRPKKTNPKQTQFKPNCRKGEIDAKCVFTKDYRKNDDFVVRINNPNFRNAQNERKRFFTKGL